jgi:hypothetical protein
LVFLVRVHIVDDELRRYRKRDVLAHRFNTLCGRTVALETGRPMVQACWERARQIYL